MAVAVATAVAERDVVQTERNATKTMGIARKWTEWRTMVTMMRILTRVSTTFHTTK